MPGRLRAVGRVVEVFPDGTSQLELQRPPHGAFGFCVTSGHGRPDKGTVGSSRSFTQTLREAWHGPSTVALVPPQEQAWGQVERAAPSLLSPKGVMVDGRMLPHVWLCAHTVPHIHQPLAWGTQPVPKGIYTVYYWAALGTPRGHSSSHGVQGGSSPVPSLSIGVYVQEMVDAGTAKLYAGLLGVGDEILQVNGAAVSGLGLARIRELLLQADTLSLRVLRHRPAPR